MQGKKYKMFNTGLAKAILKRLCQ